MKKTYRRVKLEDGLYCYDCQLCGHSDLDHKYSEIHAREHRIEADTLALVGRLATVSLLRQALKALNSAPRFNVGGTTSYRIAADIERFLNRAGGR